MTRVDLGNNTSDFEQKKISNPRKRRDFFSCLNCSLGCLGILLILVFLVLVCLAKTGLVEIPLISRIFYAKPEPLRIVNFEGYKTADLVKKLDLTTLTENPQIELSEEELSFLFNEFLLSQNIKYEKAQAALDLESSEIFLEINSPIKAIVRTDFDVSVPEKNKINIDFFNVKVGNINVPDFIVSDLEKKLNNTITDKIFDLLPYGLEINQIDILHKKARINFSPITFPNP